MRPGNLGGIGGWQFRGLGNELTTADNADAAKVSAKSWGRGRGRRRGRGQHRGLHKGKRKAMKREMRALAQGSTAEQVGKLEAKLAELMTKEKCGWLCGWQKRRIEKKLNRLTTSVNLPSPMSPAQQVEQAVADAGAEVGIDPTSANSGISGYFSFGGWL